MNAQEQSFEPAEALASAKKEFGEYGGVNASVENSTTFTVLHASTMGAIFTGVKSPDSGACYLYGRSFNPTVRYLGSQLAALEGTEAGYGCSSGMAAISTALLQMCSSGDHIIASSAVYGGTFALLKTFLPAKCNITTTFVNIADHSAVSAAFTPRTRVVYTETVSNPTLVVADLPALAAIAHSHGASFVVDNTFTPMVMTPAKWGADVVLHSMTKFMSGASDIVAGAICGTAAFIRSLMDLHLGPVMLLGPTMDPKIASELSLRLPHLGIRMAEHGRRALAFAERLEQAGAAVGYPGLCSHRQYGLMQRLSNTNYGCGGILTLDLGSQEAAEQFMERAQNKHGFGLMAVSLGYFETLMSLSGASTSSELTLEERATAGIPAGLVRMSVGLSGTLEQRWAQLAECFATVSRAGPRPFRAAEVVRDEEGKLQRLASWDSQGSDLVQFDEATPPEATTNAALRLSPEDDASPRDEEMVSAERAAGFHKMRRMGAKEVVYTRVAAHARTAAAPPTV